MEKAGNLGKIGKREIARAFGVKGENQIALEAAPCGTGRRGRP